MNIAFHAPLKPPDHPVPSGDRTVARKLMLALEGAGHRVRLASRFVSRDGAGNPARQERLAALGAGLATRLVRRMAPAPPAAWFTYHCYHKAPDLLGPVVSKAFGIPYLIAEGSHAAKRADGPWAIGQRGAEAALRAADAHIVLNPDDVAGLEALGLGDRLVPLKPFLDPHPFFKAVRRREGIPVLIAVAMFREGDKLQSYRLLGEALARLVDRAWRLVVVGDGPARADVEAALAPVGDRIDWRGAVEPRALPALYASADLLVWPAIGEAFGMALLEAQACGTPVVAGRTRGVPEVVADQVTGLLVPLGDAAAFATAVARLLDDADRRRALSEACRPYVRAHHGLAGAARLLDATLRRLVAS